MYVTDISSLGADYTVADMTGKIIGSVQVITFLEIVEAISGPYTEDFGSFEAYIEQGISCLTGFDDIDPARVLWHASSEEEVDLSPVIEFAIKNGYDHIIIEYLDNLDE